MKIKRFFIYLSTIIVTFFMIWTIVKSPDQLTFSTYSFVYVKNSEENAVNKEEVNDSLHTFAI